MAQEFSNPNQVAQANVKITTEGIDAAKADFARLRGEIDKLGETVKTLQGQQGGGSGTEGDQGGGGYGLAGIGSALKTIRNLFILTFAVDKVQKFASELDGLITKVGQYERKLLDAQAAASKAVGVLGVEAQRDIEKSFGIPELFATGKGPRERKLGEVRAEAVQKAAKELEAARQNYYDPEGFDIGGYQGDIIDLFKRKAEFEAAQRNYQSQVEMSDRQGRSQAAQNVRDADLIDALMEMRQNSRRHRR